MSNLKEAAQLFREKQSFTLIGHTNPDGDTLGSTLALGLGLLKLGKKVMMLNIDGVPEIYRFLPGSDQILKPNAAHFTAQVVVCVDCSDIKRAGDEVIPWISGANTIINIDHHISNDYFGTINIVEPEAASAGIIVKQMLEELGVIIDKDIATCLYVSLVTDTGSFKFSNTTPQSHQVAAELLSTGLDQELVNRELYEEVPLNSLRLIQAGLDNLQITPCGKVAWMTFNRQIMEELKAKDEHLEGVVNYAKTIKGVEVGILFRESGDKLVKISFRSKSTVNVSDLAAKFGGGGHIRAAGCRYRESLENAVNKVVATALEAVRGTK